MSKYKEKNYLNSLTRLFEINSMSCTAVCLINDVIIIADNNIHFTSKDNNVKIKIIKDTMKYFSDLANKKNPLNEKKIFEKLCNLRIKGEEKGYLKLSDDNFKKVVDSIFEGEWRKTWYKSKEKEKAAIKKVAREERPYIAAALEIVDSIYSDFNKIKELLITDHIKGELAHIINAFKGKETNQIFIHESGGILKEWQEHKLIQDPDQFENLDSPKNGYITLKFDYEKVHAEIRLLEYLMITGILNQTDKINLYIAISKLCCNGCYKFITEISEQYNIIINVKGSHGMQPEWIQPLILSRNKKIYGSYLEDGELKFCDQHEQKRLESKGLEIYPYTYVDNDIIDYLLTKCPELQRKSMASEDRHIHLTHFSDSDSSHASSPESQQNEKRSSKLEAINILFTAANDSNINDEELEALRQIINIVTPPVPNSKKRKIDNTDSESKSKKQKQSEKEEDDLSMQLDETEDNPIIEEIYSSDEAELSGDGNDLT